MKNQLLTDMILLKLGFEKWEMDLSAYWKHHSYKIILGYANGGYWDGRQLIKTSNQLKQLLK